MKHGIRRVCVSSGYWGAPALKDVIAVNDAFCIMLKGFTEQFYVNVLGAHLKPVMDNLVAIRQSGKWLEVVITIVPGYNDDPDLLKEQAQWVLSALGADTPLHYRRFDPEWKLANLPRIPQKTLQDARRMALDLGLKYVYIANLPGDEGNNTYCPACKKAVIERLGLVVKSNLLDKGACKSCGAKVAGVWM